MNKALVKHPISLPLLLAFGSIAFGAGCSSSIGGSGDTPAVQSPLLRSAQARHGWLVPAAKTSKTLVYSADLINNVVNIYDATVPYHLVGQIYAGVNAPNRVAIDKKQNLFVGNLGNNSVTEYKHGTITVSTTYTDDLVAPAGIAVDSDNHVYVAAAAGIIEFKEGKPAKSGLRTLPGVADGLAVDSKDNLYATSLSANGSATIYELPAKSKKSTNLGFKSFLENPSDVKLDANGNLIIADYGKHLIYIVPSGAKKPSREFGQGHLYQPSSIALNATGQQLYVADVQVGLIVFDYADGTALAALGECYNPSEGTWCGGVALNPAFKP